MAVPLRAVLFDAAGTLIEPAEPVGESYARAAAQQGVTLPAWRLDDAFRRVLARAPAMVFPDAGADELPARERGWWREVVRATFRAADSSVIFDDFDALFDALWRRFADPAAWRARAGAHAALAALAERGLALGVLSNFDGRLPALLAGLDLAAPLRCVVLPADAGAAKPDPRIFALALARLGASAAETAYVGDDPEQDLAAARRAGLRAVDVAGLATLAELPATLLAPAPEHP